MLRKIFPKALPAAKDDPWISEYRGDLSRYLPAIPPLLRQGKIRFRIASSSMVPALMPGDLVRLEPASITMLKAGDVIVLKDSRGALICHRMVRRFQEEGRYWIVTKGDRSTHEDAPVEQDQIVGRVAAVLRPRIVHRFLWYGRRWGGRFLRRLNLLKSK